ncbi:MAG: UDP-N-acetylmuramoyl-L-alanine--D-glutamate ligase [Streptococcaceae bacterium]|nr:UDP-N-acetylmuramoyl-L-alanine--D-glutamate ligase [Streptococcaceae bacterium]MCL2858236.1 UDP-N-acetylmuramoyl-L-alanine--D-glutamate ligase [Streptococcaceae bacterium]
MKKIDTFTNKKVLVLGLAKSGESAARLLVQLGAKVTINDGKAIEDSQLLTELENLEIRVIAGHHPLDLFEESFDYLIKNPGIPYENEMVVRALELNIPVLTEVELAYLISQAPIIGITGTNGKTTVTTMIAEILNRDGQSAKLAGNIGFPASEVASQANSEDTLVMELSSFQLMGIETFRPKIALIVNLFSAHLDYHGSQEAYEEAKWQIQKNMTADEYLVLNFNQEKSQILAQQTQAQVVPFATNEKVDGAYSLNGKIYFRDEEIMPVSDLSLPGEHNLENALAAIAVSKLSGVSNAAIITVLSNFAGVKHRLQYLGQLGGRKIYNDSKATNILATQKALSGFDHSSLWLLAGGLDRGNGFDELTEDVQELKGMIIFGQTAPKLKALAEKLNIPVFETDNVASGLTLAYEKSDDKDTILLSPACASWDQYKTFEERGDLFIASFQSIKSAMND